VPATSGVEPYSAAALDGWRWCETNRRPEPDNEAGHRTDSDRAERRTASAPWISKSLNEHLDDHLGFNEPLERS
jgi:hypothetical protein